MGLRGEVVIPLEADHMAMTKFTSNNDPAYHQVVQAVIGILASKPKKMLNLSKLIYQLSNGMLTTCSYDRRTWTRSFRRCVKLLLKIYGLIANICDRSTT